MFQWDKSLSVIGESFAVTGTDINSIGGFLWQPISQSTICRVSLRYVSIGSTKEIQLFAGFSRVKVRLFLAISR